MSEVKILDAVVGHSFKHVEVWVDWDKRTFRSSMSIPERPPKRKGSGRIQTWLRKHSLSRASKGQRG